jgi:hypothetical protein
MWILGIRKTGWLSDEDGKVGSPILESVSKVDMPDNDSMMAKMRTDCEE